MTDRRPHVAEDLDAKSCNIFEHYKMSDRMQFSIKVALRIYGCTGPLLSLGSFLKCGYDLQ